MTSDRLNSNIQSWQELEVGKVFDFLKTYAISRENLISGTNNINGIGNIHYGDLHAKFNSTSIDLRRVSVPLVKNEKFEPNIKDYLIDGDLIMADVSEDYNGIGVTVLVHGLENKKVVGGLHTFVLRDSKDITDLKYRQYIFRNPVIRNKLQKIANGVSVYGISKSSLSNLKLHLPSVFEQKRIVSILETWDTAIEKLARKIEVKKNVKKGLMQKLLTGKMRLPGYSEKWRVTSLQEVVNLIKNGVPRFTGLKKYFSTSAIVNNEKIDLVSYENRQSRADMYPSVNNIAIAKMKGTNRCFIVKENFLGSIFSTGFCFLQTKDNADHTFIYYLVSSDRFQYFKDLYSASGIMGGIGNKDLLSIEIKIPVLREQTAIAEVLTKCDTEIGLLQEKLNKLNDQKKYLLNNLITGKIRTPEEI